MPRKVQTGAAMPTADGYIDANGDWQPRPLATGGGGGGGGTVDIDQTVPGTTNGVVVNASALPTGASTSALQGGGLPLALAAGGGLKVEGVAGGVAMPVSGTFYPGTQPVSIAASQVVAGALVDGADLTQGALADVAVVTDAQGSISAKLRGIIKLLVDQITVKIASGTVTTVTTVTTVSTLSAITAGETHIGTVTTGGISISVTPVITDASAYSAKDAVGGEMTFANAARLAGGQGVINSVTIADNDDEKAGLELWLFSATVAEAADHSPMDFTDAELLTCVGVIPISTADYFSIADNGVACLRGIGLQFKCAATSLFGQLKCTGTPTYTAHDDLTVTLGIEYIS